MRVKAFPTRRSMSFIDSSIFETSDAEELVRYIRQKRGINNAQRIFDESPANGEADRSFPIEIQPTQENAKAVSPLKESGVEVATCSNSKILRINLKRISTQSIGKGIVSRNLGQASGSGENFEPAAFSTPNSVGVNEDPNISGISRIPLEEEIPETQGPNEVPANDYSQKTTENDNHQIIFDAGIQYSVDPPAIVHQQEETLKNNSQVDEANDNVTLVNNRVVQQNVLVHSSDSHTRSSISEDGEGNLTQNQNTKNKHRTRVSTRVEQNKQLNSSSLRIQSNENVKETIQQAVFEEPSYSNLIKIANDSNKEDRNLNKNNTDQTTSNIEYNSRRSRAEIQNPTESVQISYTKEIVQTNQHVALGGSPHSDSSSEEDNENTVPEKIVREHKNFENKSTGQSSSNRNLSSRKNGVKSSDFPTRSIQAITSDRSNLIFEENCKNSKENQNPKRIRGRSLFRNDPTSRRSKVKPRDRLLHKVPISNKKMEVDQQNTSESPSDSIKDFPRENEISKRGTGHTSPRIEQNSKNVRVVSMDGREKPLIYIPITQNFHKETERKKGSCDNEKKNENAIEKFLTTKDAGCQKEDFELITSDEEDENIMDQVLTPRKHNIETQNRKVILRQRNNTDKPEINMTDNCDVDSRAPHSSLESSNIKTVEKFNKVLTRSSMQKKGENSMNKVSQTHSSTQVVRKGKKRLSQMDPVKQDYLNIRKKLKKTTMTTVNASRRKLYSKGDSDRESSESLDFSEKLSQETPVILHSIKETKKTLNFSRNPDENVSNEKQSLQNIDNYVDDSNNEREFTDSTYTGDAVNKEDIVHFKKPTQPVLKSSKRKIAKGNRSNAVQQSNIPMEEKHHSRLVKNCEESRYNDCNSSDLPVEPSEVDDHPTRSVEFSRPSVVKNKNNTKTDETKDRSAEQSQKNKKTKYSDGRSNKPMKSLHPSSEELNEQLRRSSRQRKSPIKFWSCRYFKLSQEDKQETFSTNNKNKEKTSGVKKKNNSKKLKSKVRQNNVTSKDAVDRVAINENQIADEFDRVKESKSTNNSKNRMNPKNDENNVMKTTMQLPKNSSKKDTESNENPPKDLNKQKTDPVSSDDGISTSEENHHPKPPWCMASNITPTIDSGNQTAAMNETHVNKELRLFSWLKNLSTPRFVARCKDVVQIPHSNTFTICKFEDLRFQEINGVEYAYYFGENNNYGYIRFHPHSQKPSAKTKTSELKFLSLVGDLQLKIDEDLCTIKNGDFITIPKGARYGISNPSNDPAVLFFIRV